MLSEERILLISQKAAAVAAAVLHVDKYTIDLINDPSISEDALFDTQEDKVLINLATIDPFPIEIGFKDEDIRLALKVSFLSCHEIRHAYQKNAVQIYTVNRRLGGNVLQMPESKKKCEIWLEEMKTVGCEIEQDADAFAWYLLCRVFRMKLIKTNRYLGILKRKYDKTEINEPQLYDLVFHKNS